MANKIFTSESWDGFSTGISNLKTKINNIINGTQVVAKATNATTLFGLTSTVDELNYINGTTSNIQEQLDNKSQIQIVTWEDND